MGAGAGEAGKYKTEWKLILIHQYSMAKYKQECIFGIRAVIEAIQQEKEIDKVMLKQGIKGELFQTLFFSAERKQYPFSICSR